MKHILLITGAGKGIGRAIALEFARAARHHPDFEPVLVLSSRTAADLEKISLECRAEGALTDTITADISDMADVRRLTTHIVERYGHIDCLVNNAGVGRFGALSDLTEEDFDYTMNTNLFPDAGAVRPHGTSALGTYFLHHLGGRDKSFQTLVDLLHVQIRPARPGRDNAPVRQEVQRAYHRRPTGSGIYADVG